jgi:hypothetical protein
VADVITPLATFAFVTKRTGTCKSTVPYAIQEKNVEIQSVLKGH